MQKITKNKLAPLFLVGTSLALAACGGSSSNSSAANGISARETSQSNISEPDCTADECLKNGGFTKPFVEQIGRASCRERV